MKKTFLAMLLAGSSLAVFAQTDSVKVQTDMTNPNTTGSMTTNSSYNAYSTYTATLPTGMETYVMRDYPAATGIRWQQSGDWWHGYYVNAGMPVHLFYNERGQTFTAALPVHQSYVPDAVISKAIDLYGPVMYDINHIKGTSGQDVYLVRILENGQLSSQYMAEDGSKVIDIYRTDVADKDLNTMSVTTPATTTDSNVTTENAKVTTDVNVVDDATKMKTKTKEADGTKTKTKMENGKVKIKKE
jgi:hypothetical protein